MDYKTYSEKLDIGCKVFYVDFYADNKIFEIVEYTIYKKLSHAIGNGFDWAGIRGINEVVRLSHEYCFMTENEAKKYVTNELQKEIFISSMRILESEKHRDKLYSELMNLGYTPEMITANCHTIFDKE